MLWIVTIIRVDECGCNAYTIDTGFQKRPNDITPGTGVGAMDISRAARQMGAVLFPSCWSYYVPRSAAPLLTTNGNAAKFARVVEHLQKIFVHLVLAFGKVMFFAGSTVAIKFAVIKVLHKLERLP
jgi:hypothetical protein